MLPPDSSRRAARHMRAGHLALRGGIDVGHQPANYSILNEMLLQAMEDSRSLSFL